MLRPLVRKSLPLRKKFRGRFLNKFRLRPPEATGKPRRAFVDAAPALDEITRLFVRILEFRLISYAPAAICSASTEICFGDSSFFGSATANSISS